MRPSRVRQDYEVSIHAPVRGATFHWSEVDPGWKVSIHAPVRGATVAEATKSLCASRVSFPRCGAYNHPFLPISKTMATQ